MQPLVELRDVTFGYAGAPVLQNVSLHLHAGQFAALVGPSGAGKTSLLKLVLGRLRPGHGDSRRRPARRRQPRRRRRLRAPGRNCRLELPVTVEQVVLMGRVRKSGLWPWPTREDKRRCRAVLERLEIAPLAERHIRNLSGGQQQRVFLARALIAQPDLLVLDEPTSGVDMRTAENVLHLLADLNRTGITILMTTHDLNAAAAHLPWAICLNRTVIAEGPPEVVFTEATLNRTYQGDMVVVRQEGMLLIHQRPHAHTHRDLLPDPVPGHTLAPLPRQAAAGVPAGGASLTGFIPPVLPAKEAADDLAA